MNDVPSFLVRGLPQGMVETFAHLAISRDDSDAGLLIDQLLADGVGSEALMLELLAPAARLLGEMWCSDDANFLEVTLGLSRIQHLMRQLRLPVAGLTAERGVALLMPAPGEQHVLGLRMVEEFLIRDGWRVRLATVADAQAAGHLAAAEHYDFIGLSMSGERFLPTLRQAIGAVRALSRNPDVRIMVGGVAFAGETSVAPPPEADAVIGDAHDAVALARRWHALAGVLT